MTDRMDQLLTAAARQGWSVRQTPRGVWVFRKGMITVTVKRTPETGREWLALIGTLKGAGLVFPPEGE